MNGERTPDDRAMAFPAHEIFPGGNTGAYGFNLRILFGGEMPYDVSGGEWSQVQQARYIAEDAIRRFVDENAIPQAQRGTSATLAEAIAGTRKGGATVLTGLSRVDALGSFSTFPFVMHEKRLIGSVYGSSNPLDDIRRFVSFYREGRLKLDELTTRSYALDQINDALGALARGDGGRGVVHL